MNRIFCKGDKCPIKKTCIRYTKGLVATAYDKAKNKYIKSCTNQRKYMQDIETINPDSKRI